MIWIGIDPGEHTGIAVWDSDEHAFIDITTCKLHEAFTIVHTWAVSRPLKVVFEDARLRKWFKQETSTSEYRGKLMGAGAAKRDSAIWEEFLTDYGIPFEARKPQPGGTKWNKEYWERVTGWTKRTSEHARDAALLVFQKTT